VSCNDSTATTIPSHTLTTPPHILLSVCEQIILHYSNDGKVEDETIVAVVTTDLLLSRLRNVIVELNSFTTTAAAATTSESLTAITIDRVVECMIAFEVFDKLSVIQRVSQSS
jgi:hypothetical protein